MQYNESLTREKLTLITDPSRLLCTTLATCRQLYANKKALTSAQILYAAPRPP